MHHQDSHRLSLARASAVVLAQIALLVLIVVIPPGCGLASTAAPTDAGRQLIRGRDSAGAIIELEKIGVDFTKARVIDVVLGTGESEIISVETGSIEFTIDFPGGATITYHGWQTDASESELVTLSGTWHQQSGGVFGEDTGTWEAQDPLNENS